MAQSTILVDLRSLSSHYHLPPDSAHVSTPQPTTNSRLLQSPTMFCVPVHPVFDEYPPPDTEPAVACTTPFWAVVESREKTTATQQCQLVVSQFSGNISWECRLLPVLEAEKVEALCEVRILLSVTAPGDAAMKETVVVIMLAPELLCVSCRLQSMYDGLPAVKTSQDSPQRRVKLMKAIKSPQKASHCEAYQTALGLYLGKGCEVRGVKCVCRSNTTRTQP